MVEQLTENHLEQLSIYCKEWRKAVLCSTPIECSTIEAVIQASYSELGLRVPKILFLHSPYAAVEIVVSKQLKNPIANIFSTNYVKALIQQISIQLEPNVKQELSSSIQEYQRDFLFRALEIASQELLYPLLKPLPKEERSRVKHCIKPESLIQYGVFIDFSISILGCTYDLIRWQILRSLIQQCGWIYPFREACIVCERPLQCNYRLSSYRSIEKLTISFRDGHKLRVFGDEKKANKDDWNMWMGSKTRLEWI